ncbi:SMI1/KNR4 family protein [Vibrio mimicus]|uniref:SMI1/KNR4 family protein n=1 Tax=Vibrio mimicus TaxID=674 RepID=A0A2J9VLK7_VIBMI|nr:hypothetical protein [Vibrio mimicus]EEW10057.1 hypothetical protein VMD_24530 [Vibrio mimicus VM573]KFE29478.1 hypothetical protein DN31_3816 [Vibrio mimicus]PNM64668.1 hypothetical protein AL544_002500 [Vibrio mimicus]
MKDLHRLLNELCACFESKGHLVASSLLAPLTEKELEAKCASWFPGEIPTAIKDLYTWKGGQGHNAWEEEFPFWFRDMSFISLDQAEAEYESMNQSYGVENTLEEDGVLIKDCFPFAAFNGGWFVIPASKSKWSNSFDEPVICIFQGIEQYYHSIDKMVKTVIECIQYPTWSTEESYIPEDIEMKIWKKHNPGIFEE